MSLLIPVLLLGLVGGLSPSTIALFILLLATTRAKANASAFLVGWGLSLAVVFAGSYAIGGAHSLQHRDHSTVAIVEIVVGVALAVMGVRQWQHRHEPKEPSERGLSLMARMKTLNPWQAVAVGVVKQPWTLTAAAAVLVVRHDATFGIVVVTFILFTLGSTAAVGLIFLYYSLRPGEAEKRLADLWVRAVRAGPTVFTVVSLLVGAGLIADGIAGRSGH